MYLLLVNGLPHGRSIELKCAIIKFSFLYFSLTAVLPKSKANSPPKKVRIGKSEPEASRPVVKNKISETAEMTVPHNIHHITIIREKRCGVFLIFSKRLWIFSLMVITSFIDLIPYFYRYVKYIEVDSLA